MTRAAALLSIAGSRIADLERRPASGDPEKSRNRAAFDRALVMVRAMADGRPVYDMEGGIAYLVPETPRLAAISHLARVCRVSEDALGAEVDRIATERDKVTALLEGFMGGLPRPRLGRLIPLGRSARTGSSYDVEALDRAMVNPTLSSTDGRQVELPEEQPANRAAMLRACVLELEQLEKSGRDAAGKLRARIDDPDELEREDRETLEPMRERAGYMRSEVVRCALLLARADDLPGDGTIYEKARKLDVSQRVGDDELFEARIRLGI